LFAQAIAKEEDRIVFTGNVNVSDPFNGVLYDPGVRTYTLPSGKTAFTDITVDQLADITSMQTNTLSEGAKFYMHRTMFNILRQKKDKEESHRYRSGISFKDNSTRSEVNESIG
jgi:HK97 family phage major capsid protein